MCVGVFPARSNRQAIGVAFTYPFWFSSCMAVVAPSDSQSTLAGNMSPSFHTCTLAFAWEILLRRCNRICWRINLLANSVGDMSAKGVTPKIVDIFFVFAFRMRFKLERKMSRRVRSSSGE